MLHLQAFFRLYNVGDQVEFKAYVWILSNEIDFLAVQSTMKIENIVSIAETKRHDIWFVPVNQAEAANF